MHKELKKKNWEKNEHLMVKVSRSISADLMYYRLFSCSIHYLKWTNDTHFPPIFDKQHDCFCSYTTQLTAGGFINRIKNLICYFIK